MTDWISGEEAAEVIGVSRSTVYRSLKDETERAQQWGAEGEGWRYKPLSRRRIFQVSRARAQQIAEFALYDSDPRLVDSELDQYLSVTAEDIKRAVARYVDVENRDVGAQLANPLERLLPVAGLREHLEVRRGLDRLPQSLANDRMVVRDGDIFHFWFNV